MSEESKTPQELLELLKAAKERGYITGNLPTEGPQAEFMARTLSRNLTSAEPERIHDTPIQKGAVVGNLSLILKFNPTAPWDDTTDRHLYSYLEGDEWEALFYTVLGCPTTDDVSLAPTENIGDWDDEYRERFQAAIPGYPKLGRIWSLYSDVTYEPEEIEHLRQECLKVRVSTSNYDALKGLNKLILACDMALRKRVGLLLASN